MSAYYNEPVLSPKEPPLEPTKARRDLGVIDAGFWRCPDCRFGREYATAAGAFEGAAKHLWQAHKIRLAIKRARS